MTRCIPFSVICFLSQSGMTSDGYRRGYLLLYFYIFLISSFHSSVLPQFYYIKVGFTGVFIARTCFPDVI